MEIFKLLKREIKTPSNSLAGFILLSSVSNAFLIGIINGAAESVASKQMNWQYFVMYLLCLGIFFYSKKYTLDRSSEIVEMVINRLRLRLVDKVRLTELVTLEKYGTATLYARITQDATTISNISTIIINSLQQSIMIVCTLLYIAAISMWSFLIIVAGLALGLMSYMNHSAVFQAMWQEVSRKETSFFEKLNHILRGFNEININRRKNEDVYNEYVRVNNALRSQRLKTSKMYNVTLTYTQILFYLLLGAILFVLPRLQADNSAAVIMKVVSSVLFIIGPLEGILYSIPGLASANNSANNIMDLEAQLEEELKKQKEQQINHHAPEAYQLMPFEHQIDLRGLEYQYKNNGWNGNGASFKVGPINLTIRKGELIFITGGNGSGKSSFAKLLTGLYKPAMGQIIIDGTEDGRGGIEVNMRNYQQYQNLYSIIFSDFHLFDKVYGLEHTLDPVEVNALLQSMNLSSEKTSYKDGAFTNIHLSSGQKKRLALTTVLLEDKPIYFFDEVASDLDPEFRDKFYYEILSELKARNKTVIVISHDQQYWNVPDRLLQFQDGRMRELSKTEVVALVSSMITKHG
ncbi:MAG: cyclic peptide export ABC transporter [Bacteroidota bacterium]